MFTITAAAEATMNAATEALRVAIETGSAEAVITAHAAAHEATITYGMIAVAEAIAWDERVAAAEAWWMQEA